MQWLRSQKTSVLVALILAVLWVRPSYCDLIPPGYRRVSHTLCIEPSEKLEKVRLVAAPVLGFGGVSQIEPGVPFSFSGKYGTKIYAVPEDVGPLKDFDREKFKDWPSIDPPVEQVANVPVSSPITSVETTLSFNGISGNELNIGIVRHIEHGKASIDDRGANSQGKTWSREIVLALAGGVILVGVLLWQVLARRTSST